jgi:type I restriction enzyme S subunit
MHPKNRRKMGSKKHTDLPSGWDEILLKDFANFFSGGTPKSTNPDFYNGNIPFIKSGEIYYNKTAQFLSEEGLNNSSAKKVKVGDLLYALYGANSGEISISKLNGAINQAILCIRPNEKVNTKYLYNYLRKQKENIIQNFLQGGQGNLSAEIIKNLKIPLPPLPEQRAIANILSTWDTAIQTTQALIAQKEQEKKWLMQNLLTGKKRLPAFANATADKKGFSENWMDLKIDDLFERVTSKNTEKNQNVVTISAQRGFVRQTDFFNKNVASELLDNYFLVEKGEFCYNKSYSNGYPWGATKRLNDFEKAVVTTLYICFKLKDYSKNSGDFFEQFFNANLLDKGLTKIAHEGGRAHGLLNVTPSDFFSLKINIPSYQEQTAIAQVLQTADKEIELLKTKLEQQKLQKKGLMQVLLTGKWRVKTE